MAIYSLHHTAIGKTSQAQAYTASAHIRYITRPRALSRLDGERMPISRAGACGWLRDQEDADRKNARVADKVMLALPKELNAEQRSALVRAFAEAVTLGRAPWIAAFHEKGKDASNPHCHLVIRDRDLDTGRRAIGMSEAGSTIRLRQLWEEFANCALEKAGRAERIDRRTLRAQGMDRSPTIHEGVRAQQMHRRGARTRSRSREYINGKGARQRSRNIDYSRIDKGLSRPAYNESLRIPFAESERDFWAAIDADRQRSELNVLRAVHRPEIAAASMPLVPDGEFLSDARWSRRSGSDDLDLDLDR